MKYLYIIIVFYCRNGNFQLLICFDFDHQIFNQIEMNISKLFRHAIPRLFHYKNVYLMPVLDLRLIISLYIDHDLFSIKQNEATFDMYNN